MSWRILRRAVSRAAPAPVEPTASGEVTFLQKWCRPAGPQYNRGETATFPPRLAAWLVAEGIARPGRHRIPRLHPQPAREPAPPPREHDPEIASTIARDGVWFPSHWPDDYWITKG